MNMKTDGTIILSLTNDLYFIYYIGEYFMGASGEVSKWSKQKKKKKKNHNDDQGCGLQCMMAALLGIADDVH